MEISFLRLIALAGADAVNPCALAVLVLVLVALLTAERKKSDVLKGGLMFTLAVFIFYILYGLIMIGIFKSVENTIAGIRIYLLKGLGVFAMFLGALNIKDFFFYKAGSVMTRSEEHTSELQSHSFISYAVFCLKKKKNKKKKKKI